MKKVSIIAIILLLFANLGLASRKPHPEHPNIKPLRQKPWTILVFMNGDNNLEGAAIDDINEMERAVDTTLYNVVVEIDRIPGYDNSNGNWATTRDYYITYDPNGDRIIRSELWWDPGEQNMGDPNTFVNFVNYYIDYFQSDHYLVILWDHGNGWYARGVKEHFLKMVGHDVTDDDYFGVADSEYYNALDAIASHLGRPIDILAHDECLMGMHEVAYEAKDFAGVVVFSEFTEPGGGYPYTEIFNWLNSNSNATAQEFATTIVNEFIQSYQPGGSQYCQMSATQSAIVTGSPLQNLCQSINIFAQELMYAGGIWNSDIQSDREATQEFPWGGSDSSHIDLWDFAFYVSWNSNLPTSLRNAADSVLWDVMQVVIVEGHYSDPNDHNVDDASGIAIYYPKHYLPLDTTYSWLRFANDYPKWWSFIQGEFGIQEQPISPVPSQLFFLLSPNPCHGKVTIQYNITTNAKVSLKIFNVAGRLIETVIDGKIKAGSYSVLWDGTTEKGLKVPAGVYFCRIESDNHSTTAKLTLIR